MATSFFQNAHNFSVGEMNVRNVGGDYIDHSSKNVRNVYRGPRNYYETHDHSYHDNSNHHHGNTYNTTNHNNGPVNNIDRVDNANFGTNYGHISQNTFDGPQQSNTTNHHHNATTNNYHSSAVGGSVVNGDVNGSVNHFQGPPSRGPGPNGPQRGQGPSPAPRGPMGDSSRRSPSPNPNYGPNPNYPPMRPPPGPAPGQYTASDPAVPQQQYREQQSQSDGPPSPAFNPWGNQPPPPQQQQQQQQHLSPPPHERVNTAPGRPQPNEEWREHESHPSAAPPAAYPPAANQQHRAPSPAPNPPRPSGSSGLREQERLDAPPRERRPERNSWSGKTQLKEAFKENGISDSEDSDAMDISYHSDSPKADGYGIGSGRRAAQLSKEKEALKESDSKKQKDTRNGQAPGGVWKGNPLLSEEDLGQSYLSAPSREHLPPYVGSSQLTPTPVLDNSRKSPMLTPAPMFDNSRKSPMLTPTPVFDSSRKSAPSPAPSQKLQEQSSLSARPRNTPNALSSGHGSLAMPPPEASTSSNTHKSSSSFGGAGVNVAGHASFTKPRSRPSIDSVSEHEENGQQNSFDLHGVFVAGADKKKKKGILKKVFGSRKKSLG